MRRMKMWLGMVLLAVLALGAKSEGQAAYNADRDQFLFKAQGVTYQLNNRIGALNLTFEYVMSGSPGSVVMTIQGCMRGGTCDTLDTYTGTSSTVRKITGLYDNYQITSTTLSGGTSPTVQMNAYFTSTSSPTSAQGSLSAQVQGTAASGSAPVWNPLLMAGVANAAPPTDTEAAQAPFSLDLAGNLRVYAHPTNVLGCYKFNARTNPYSGLAAGAPLLSMRWGDATHIAIIMRVQVSVTTTVAATVAGPNERELIIARGFTASDTGGAAITLTGNNQKMRTSQGTSLFTDVRVFGNTITPGTRTLDANPISAAMGWGGLNFTGIAVGGGGGAQTSAAWSNAGDGQYVDLLNATNGQEYPIVLSTNEGIIGRIGKDAQPTGATNQTYWQVTWCEASAY